MNEKLKCKREYNFASVSRESGLLAICRRNDETEEDRRTRGPQGPGTSLYRRIIAKDARTDEGVRDFVFDKIILAPGNEVTRALITRRLIANYERTWFALLFFFFFLLNFSRASRWRTYQIREVIFRDFFLSTSTSEIFPGTYSR